MKKLSMLLLLAVTLLFTVCTPPYDCPIYILYDNDVHCSVEGYEKVADIRAELLKQTIYVNVVSCGDFVQGNKVGSVSKGKYPVAVMNAVPYDYVTLGNHEFDYGVGQLKKLMRWLHAKCLCCNLTYLPTGKNLYDSYEVRSYGNKYVAFIGVATPTTITNSIPTNFEDEQGNLLYDFHSDDLIMVVQQAVNAARAEGVDKVIVLSHLGDDTKMINSVDLIEQTSGIDVVLDGHSHHVINTKVANMNGDSVILASTGSNFRYVGKLLIDKDNSLHNELVDLSQYEGTHERMHSRIQSILKKVDNKTSKYVGYSEVTLNDMDGEGNRIVRMEETNLGDFVADAMRSISQSDIGVSNGGGLRSSLRAGNVTFGDLLQVLPFNNSLYKVQATGQQVLDALEIAVYDLKPESGDFLHVSGMRYVVDMAVPTSVYVNGDGVCDSIGDTRRIVRAEIERGGEWLPICPDSMYTIGGQNYLLVCGGAAGMFDGTQLLDIDHISDVDVLIKYIHQLGDTIREDPYLKPQERIQIININ